MVADALSRKNTTLLTQLDFHILGLDEIKNLYANDPFFGEIFAKCTTQKGFDDFYLHKGFLFKTTGASSGAFGASSGVLVTPN